MLTLTHEEFKKLKLEREKLKLIIPSNEIKSSHTYNMRAPTRWFLVSVPIESQPKIYCTEEDIENIIKSRRDNIITIILDEHK